MNELQRLSARIGRLQAEFWALKKAQRGTAAVREVSVKATVVKRHVRVAHKRYLLT